jgi:hypothetical protein
VPPDAEPVSLPVQIVQADGGVGPCNPTRVLKDFGLVKIDGDKTFEASVNFGRDRGDTATPKTPPLGQTVAAPTTAAPPAATVVPTAVAGPVAIPTAAAVPAPGSSATRPAE